MKPAFLRRAVLGVGLVAGLASLASAFVLLSPPRKWHAADRPRNFTIGMAQGENSLASAYTQAAAESGVLSWNPAVGGPAIVSRTVSGSLGNVGFVNNGISTISFEDPQHALSGGTLAATTVGWYSTGATETTNGTAFFRFTDADVVTNNGIDFTSFADADANGANGSQYDLEGILVHEVGHAIGLGHGPAEQTTLFATFGTHDYRKRTLDDDDVNGGRFIYVNGFSPANFPPGSQLVADSTFLGLSTATFKPNSKVYVRVTVVDENGNTVTGASVAISVTRPDGSVATGTGTVSSTGRITFDTGSAQHGNYSTTVTNIAKAGMTFAPAAGKSSDTVTF